MQEIKTCLNCKNYVQHYYIYNAALLKLNCDSCRDKRKIKEIDKPCEKWEIADSSGIECKQQIDAVLRKIAARLDKIALILKHDIEKS